MKKIDVDERYIHFAIADIRSLMEEFEDAEEDDIEYERLKALEHAVEILHSISGDRLPNPNIRIEDINLVIAAITGDIYIADIEEEGLMNTFYRRVATKDVQIAMAEWFMKNEKNEIKFSGHGTLKWVPENENVTSQEESDVNKND